MKFYIDSILLWPKKTNLTYRRVKFEPDKINIITGASRTGKSTIIPIIDYCLGSGKCTIPVDTIRNACAWFGVLFSLEDEQLLLCRREPGNQMATGDMFILRNKEIVIPETIETNTTLAEVKNVLNELFSMSFLDLDPTSNNFSSHPSYRDFMAFLFQPQNIVANADVLFYKADTTEHRQKLINIFPYALGAVTPKVLAARQELDKLKKQRDRLLHDIKTIKDVSEGWKQEVAGWLAQAKDMGLTTAHFNEYLSFDDQVQQLESIVEKVETDTQLVASNIKDSSAELVELRKEEQDIASQLFALQKRHTEMLQLRNSMGQYEESLQVQLQRLEISAWLKTLCKSDDICPFCNSSHSGVVEELDVLCQAIEEIEKSTGNMQHIPAAFERELQVVETEIEYCTEKLNAIRNRIREESGRNTIIASKKYTLEGIAHFLGRLEASIKTFQRVGKNSDLENQLNALEDRIHELENIVHESEIGRKIDAATKYINQKIVKIIEKLDVEHPDNPVEFIIKDLTIKVKNASGRDDYLWEIGSASNWLAYHIGTILAFQQFFQTRGSVSIPNFVIFDQPSQVYFPHLSHNTTSSEEDVHFADEDKLAVQKIFVAMDKYLQDTKNAVQIIVTEHADEDIWGDLPSSHLVERWRGSNKKLIPSEWITPD
ncbi:DUF3732 domain-containing protein [Anaerotignum lactatifermentans]|uniref:DUF3732 domain-containing protein n=1 Tax=Anaerotignum lactatifermentans TaxID=160404 RepID=UPI00267319E5|nr:DUF3732 domain-containing protein [Anaerotignum lactatifermentans]